MVSPQPLLQIQISRAGTRGGIRIVNAQARDKKGSTGDEGDRFCSIAPKVARRCGHHPTHRTFMEDALLRSAASSAWPHCLGFARAEIEGVVFRQLQTPPSNLAVVGSEIRGTRDLRAPFHG
jgi:hypothetical protein